tara:strand:- start:5140 stop:6096 length:957 start_codon:yes stop_codon:yes gene_type:complete
VAELFAPGKIEETTELLARFGLPNLYRIATGLEDMKQFYSDVTPDGETLPFDRPTKIAAVANTLLNAAIGETKANEIRAAEREIALDAGEISRVPGNSAVPGLSGAVMPPQEADNADVSTEVMSDDPLASAPAVRASKASTATNRNILPGGETVEDEEGWSYKRFDNGDIQIVTAPDSNKSAIGMMLTADSTGDSAGYYEAISGFMKRKLDSPMSDLEATAMPEEETMAGIDADAKVEAEAPVKPDELKMSDMSAADARKASRRMRMNQRQQKARDRVGAKQDERAKKAKEIAGRFLKNRPGLLRDEDEDGQPEMVGE